MPRGNDADQAAKDLAQSMGGDYPGLDDLIREHHASLDPRVQAAQGWGYDVDATENLDLTKLKVKDGVVLSAAVRRNRDEQLVIAVVEFDGGVYKKVGLDFDKSLLKSAKAASKGSKEADA